jgi:uncharacterized membrane protein YkgB
MDRRAAPGLVVERARRAGFADSNRAKEYSASLGAVVVTDSIAALLDMTMVTVALGGMSRAFQAPIATTQWVTTAHLLSIAMVITVTNGSAPGPCGWSRSLSS